MRHTTVWPDDLLHRRCQHFVSSRRPDVIEDTQQFATGAPRSSTMSTVVSATATPAARNASSLLLAVPRLPETMAPACPMRLPSGAVRPEMNATVRSREPAPSSSAARSSSEPPISPMTTRWVVAGSRSNSAITSEKERPRTGSPPMPTIVDGRRHEDAAGRRSRLGDGAVDRVEHRHAEVGAAALARADATDQARAHELHLLGVERALAARDALHDDGRLGGEQDGHQRVIPTIF